MDAWKATQKYVTNQCTFCEGSTSSPAIICHLCDYTLGIPCPTLVVCNYTLREAKKKKSGTLGSTHGSVKLYALKQTDTDGDSRHWLHPVQTRPTSNWQSDYTSQLLIFGVSKRKTLQRSQDKITALLHEKYLSLIDLEYAYYLPALHFMKAPLKLHFFYPMFYPQGTWEEGNENPMTGYGRLHKQTDSLL